MTLSWFRRRSAIALLVVLSTAAVGVTDCNIATPHSRPSITHH